MQGLMVNSSKKWLVFRFSYFHFKSVSYPSKLPYNLFNRVMQNIPQIACFWNKPPDKSILDKYAGWYVMSAI